MSKNLDNLSIFISLVLRHKPEAANIKLNNNGWANVQELIYGINATGRIIDFPTLEEIVRSDKKQRYSFNDDKTLIRANQGHSVKVDVDLEEKEPPAYLYHGTAEKYIDSIMQEGLKPQSRLYVHLSKDIETATNVGSRHGVPVILKVNTKQMYRNGIKFYLSANGVWLTKFVDKNYLERMV